MCCTTPNSWLYASSRRKLLSAMPGAGAGGGASWATAEVASSSNGIRVLRVTLVSSLRMRGVPSSTDGLQAAVRQRAIQLRKVAREGGLQHGELEVEIRGELREHHPGLICRLRVGAVHVAQQRREAVVELDGKVERVLRAPVLDLVQLALDGGQAVQQ